VSVRERALLGQIYPQSSIATSLGVLKINAPSRLHPFTPFMHRAKSFDDWVNESGNISCDLEVERMLGKIFDFIPTCPDVWLLMMEFGARTGIVIRLSK
jgi:hypothetical protein